MDSFTFASLAQIKILLMPVGSIKRSVFDKWASEIREFDNIRLGDIPADPQEEKGVFIAILVYAQLTSYGCLV